MYFAIQDVTVAKPAQTNNCIVVIKYNSLNYFVYPRFYRNQSVNVRNSEIYDGVATRRTRQLNANVRLVCKFAYNIYVCVCAS